VALVDRLSAVRSKTQTLGVNGVVTHLARRALAFAPGGEAFRMFLVVLSQPRPSPESTRAARDHTFRFATLDDLTALLADPGAEIAERDLVSFKDGNRCLLQYDGAALVGYSWISNSPLIDLMWGMHFNLPDDMVYNYNGFTTPAYRGTAYQSLRHLKLLELTRSEGKQRLLGYVDHLNYKSLRGVRKSGYQRVGVLRGIKRAGRIRFSLFIDEENWSTAIRAGPHHR
jgi:hypothetical protein